MKNLLISFLILVIATRATLAEDPNDCATVKIFGGVGGQAEKDVKDVGVCKHLKKTCCADDDFKVIEKNYNGPTGDDEEDNGSFVQRRIEEAWNAIKLLQGNILTINAEAVKFLSMPDVAGDCKDGSNILKDFVFSNIDVDTMKNNANVCFQRFDKLRRGFYCGLCDFSLKDSFTVGDTPSVQISQKECTAVFNECSDYLDILHSKLYTWFENLEKMSRCDDNGKTSGTKAQVDRPVPQAIAIAVTNCKSGTQDDCNTVCSSGLNFGTESLIFHGSSDYFNTVLYNYGKNTGKDWKFSEKVKERIDWTNLYWAWKNKQQGKEPAQPTGKRFYKMGQIGATIKAGSGDFTDDAADSELTEFKTLSFIGRMTVFVIGLIGFIYVA